MHSYCPDIFIGQTAAVTEYAGVRFSGALQRDNFFGTQFHPEKSGSGSGQQGFIWWIWRGAKESCPKNLEVFRNITRETGLKVEFGGGVKSEESLKAVLDAGSEYVICGVWLSQSLGYSKNGLRNMAAE